ncbi:flagellar hook-basal body complex protein FliE [Vibrio nomapromontoriensis]|uniref:flagellar hook-basal body complex protein FliE n=1 Tax=Vibrio nomapromontoriensis TaxID=2910246 RepID=UPI003D0E8928
MDKISVMELQQQLVGKMEVRQQVATNPLSNQPISSPFVHGVSRQSLSEVTPISQGSLEFGQALKGVLDTVNQYQSHASEKVTAVDLGKSDDLIGATVAAQKAQLSFNALMQVRNKMVSNFEDIIKMPI